MAQSVYPTARHEVGERFVTKSSLQKVKLQGKLKCPWCEKCLMYLYSEVRQGRLSVKCQNCRRMALIDIATGEAVKIIDS